MSQVWGPALKHRTSFHCNHNSKSLTTTIQAERGQSYLCEVEVEQAECEELQADGAAVEQPVGQRLQLVGLHHIFKVEREEGRPQSSPQQAQEQKHALVAEALVSVVQNEPELQVNEKKQARIEDDVDGGETELQRWGYCSSGGLRQ